MSDIATKLTTIAENQQRVYDAGYEKGKTEGGYNDGYDAGIQAEYDRFWDAFQQNGERTVYTGLFARAWTDEIFQPKYNITPKGNGGGTMFQTTGITDLKDKLDTLGVKLDTSNCTSLIQAFQDASITHIPELDLRQVGNLSYTFAKCNAVTIDKLIVSEATALHTATFNQAKDLQNITFDGTIAASVNLQWSPLTKASIESVVATLSTTTTGQTATFKKTAVNTAFETSEGAADGSTSEEWLALVATKTNWTISLV